MQLTTQSTLLLTIPTDLVELLKTQPIEDAFILIKGSRGMKLEQMVDCL